MPPGGPSGVAVEESRWRGAGHTRPVSGIVAQQYHLHRVLDRRWREPDLGPVDRLP
jgi:hypothetical protein